MHMCVCVYMYIYIAILVYVFIVIYTYGMATISRLLKITGLFCKRALYKRRYSAQETYNFKESTNRSHPIATLVYTYIYSYVCVSIHDINKCMYARAYIYMYIYIYMHIHLYMCTHIYTCICMYICA